MKKAKLSEKELLRKHAIGRAAAKLFDRRGYLETSLLDIAAEAGLSKGAIYYYFSSKHELLFFILDAYMDSLLRGLPEELAALAPGRARVEHITRRHLSLYNNRVPEAKALLVDAPNLPRKQHALIAQKQKRYAAHLVEALDDYFGGKTAKVYLKAIAYILFGMCNSVMHWHDPEGPIKLAELSDMVVGIFLGGTAQQQGAGRRRAEGT